MKASAINSLNYTNLSLAINLDRHNGINRTQKNNVSQQSHIDWQKEELEEAKTKETQAHTKLARKGK